MYQKLFGSPADWHAPHNDCKHLCLSIHCSVFSTLFVFIFICSYVFLQVQIIPKRQIRVLSLFSGLLSGLTVLKRLKVQVDTFFSCEILDTALRFQEARFPGEIIQLGDVKNLSEDKLCSLGRIDLLIGGAPCQGLECFHRSVACNCKCSSTFNLSLVCHHIQT